MTHELLFAFLSGAVSSAAASLVLEVVARGLNRTAVQHQKSVDRNLVKEARKALSFGAHEAAVILAAAALEVELLRLLPHGTRAKSVSQLVDKLVQSGQLSDEVRRAITEIWAVRNTAAHAQRAADRRPSEEQARTAVTRAERLLAELKSAA
jgi:HEPN domain-containing protein